MGQFYEVDETGKITVTAAKIGHATGVMHATDGDLSAASVILSSEVSGTLPIANGGTGKTTISVGKIWYSSAVDTLSEAPISAFGRSLVDDVDAPAARTTLGLVIGTNVQAYDVGLLSIAGLTTAADKLIYTTAPDTYAVATLTAAGRAILDDVDATAQRVTLGLGSIATQSAGSVAITGGSISGITDLAVADGGTGASTLTGYVKGSGSAALTASATIPHTDITGLGTMSTQNAATVAVTGGSISGITDLAIADGGTGASTALAAINNLLPAQAGQSGLYLTTDGTNPLWDVPTFTIPPAAVRWIAQGEAMVYSDIVKTLMDKPGTVSSVLIYSDTAPVGSNLQIDVKKNGVSVFSTKPEVGAGSNSKTVQEVFNGGEVFAAGDRFSLDITAVGSTTPGGNDLLVTLVME